MLNILYINKHKFETKQLKLQQCAAGKNKGIRITVVDQTEPKSKKVYTNELIGQSIEVPMYEAILESVKKHIEESYMQLNRRLF